MACQGFLQCTLKMINFLVTVVGLYMVIYSLWMLKEWKSLSPSGSEAPVPAPIPLSGGLPSLAGANMNFLASELQNPEDIFVHQLRRPFLSGQAGSFGLPDLPAPWFIYAFLGAGAITCFVSLTGHIAAECSHGFCLSCYTVLQIILLLAQFAIAGALFFDHHWREDIPEDPTGELDKVQQFVIENLDICKWVALGVVLLEVLGLFFAILLRAFSVSSQRNYDSDDEYRVPRSAPRQPAGNRQSNQATAPSTPGTPAEPRPPRNDAWSTRMREKYGLDTTEFSSNPTEPRRFAQPNQAPTSTEEQQQSRCTIM